MVFRWGAGAYGSLVFIMELFQSGCCTYRVLFCLTVYFLLRWETQRYSRQRPCFFPSEFERVDSCVGNNLCVCVVASYYVFSCVRACVFWLPALCCSCCDRWSAAHAQINSTTLMKSGFCWLSVSLPIFHSFVSKPRAHRNRGNWIWELQNYNHPLARWAERDRREEGDGWVEKQRIEKKD